jgi:hypothetical protein
MAMISSLIVATAVGALPVELSTLDGERHVGRLMQISPATVTLQQEKSPREFPLSEVMNVRFTEVAAIDSNDSQTRQVVFIVGTKLGCGNVEIARQKATLATNRLDALQAPVEVIASIQFQSADAGLLEAWHQLLERELKRDLLVIRKGNVLDHLDGIVGGINAKSVVFVHDGEEIPIPLSKVFGVVYAGRKRIPATPLCRIVVGGGDVLVAKSLAWVDARLHAELLCGAEVTLPEEKLALIDFSLGKVRYLSDMEPREVKYTPFFDITWKYRRDQNLDGGPIRVGNREYARGLSIHSRTYLRYRLARDYRRFRAIMGIDGVVGRRGDVHVVISGDKKPLLEADVRGSDNPREIDLDVTNVRDLEILVDFGGDLDIADHLDLADAKVIK